MQLSWYEGWASGCFERNNLKELLLFSRSVVSNSSLLCGYRPLGSSVDGILQARIQESVAIPFFKESFWPGQDLPDLGIQPGFPTLQTDSLQSELPGKPIPTYTYADI